jgi:hypothetical protein
MVAIMWLLASDGEAVPTYWFNHNGKINQNLSHHQRRQWRAYFRAPRLSFIQRGP